MTMQSLFGRGLPLLWLVVCVAGAGGIGCGGNTGGGAGNDNDGNTNVNDNANTNDNDNANSNQSPLCPDGTDQDGDGYGMGCPAGLDCDDLNPLINPAATEVCNHVDDDCDGDTDEGVLNACGNCSALCSVFDLGNDPFPMPPDDPDADADGVGLDLNGDLILDQTNTDFNYLWIANRMDAASRGTISKIDTVAVVEVARYYTVTCFGNAAYQNGDCFDVAGLPIQIEANHPSRTAVDFNFDVWAANRAFSGQPSVTKIASSLADCVDRNGNGVIDTSQDWDSDGVINLDCNSDGVPDDITITCPTGDPPEFLGHDDECVLHTTNYAGFDELGRSVCLDAGDFYSGGAGNAWVGTYQRAGNNKFFKIDGTNGGIVEEVNLPAGIHIYGCTVDGHGILWAPELGSAGQGRMTYFDTANTTNIGPIIQNPYGGFYGLSMDSDQNIWLAGCGTKNVNRYRPDRTAFSTLSQGTWTQVRTAEEGNIVNHTRGMAVDQRGWVWAAATAGWIYRIPQNLPDGDHSWATAVASGAMRIDTNLGAGMIGVGVDFSGHVWGMSYSNSTATRVDLDSNGDPVDLVNNVFTTAVGLNPYTYSDFTGFGLRNFTRPMGTYGYLMEGCIDDSDTTWLRVEWNATTPQSTTVRLRVRTGDDPNAMGAWFGMWDTSPAHLDDPVIGPVVPNPGRYIYVEFELASPDQNISPILHDYQIIWNCSSEVPQ